MFHFHIRSILSLTMRTITDLLSHIKVYVDSFVTKVLKNLLILNWSLLDYVRGRKIFCNAGHYGFRAAAASCHFNYDSFLLIEITLRKRFRKVTITFCVSKLWRYLFQNYYHYLLLIYFTDANLGMCITGISEVLFSANLVEDGMHTTMTVNNFQ